MSFRTQKLANYFPSWTKLRSDPSSFGQRLLSVYADYFEQTTADLVKLKEEFHLLRHGLPVPWFWLINLSGDDGFTYNLSVGGFREWVYPTSVVGNHPTLGALALTKIDVIEDFINAVPDRVSLSETIAVATTTIWESSAPTTYNAIAYNERLYVEVANSADFFPKGVAKNVRANGRHRVRMEGFDASGIKFIEYVDIRDDGYYMTENVFSKLELVEAEGFDGDVTVSLPRDTDWITDRFRIGVSDRTEGPLKIECINNGKGFSYVNFFTDFYKNGISYKDGTSTEPVVENKEELWSSIPLDGGGSVAPIIDICVSERDQKLYGVSSAGDIYVYDHTRISFTPPSEESTLTTSSLIEILSLYPYSVGGSDIELTTWFKKPAEAVRGVVIKRVSPSAVVEYLQADYTTWAAAPYEFQRNIVPLERASAADSWSDFNFVSAVSEYGLWEFYCIQNLASGSQYISYTGVQADTMSPVAEISTGIGSIVAIYESQDGSLVLKTLTDCYKYDRHSDVYLCSPEEQQIGFREEYDSVEVTF